MKRVTQSDIANVLNISRTTVARALNNTGPIDEETRKKVLEVANKLGYKVNPIAKSLAMKRTLYIYAFLIESYNTFYFNDLIYGMKEAEKEFKDFGVQLKVIGLDSEKPELHAKIIDETIKNNRVDGLILMTMNLKETQEMISRFSANGIPIATVDLDIRDSSRSFWVGPDYYKTGRIACELFSKLLNGEGKILTFTSSFNYPSVKDRLKGFLDKASEYKDIEIVGPYFDNYNLNTFYAKTMELLNSIKNVKAIYSTCGTEYIVRAIKDMKLDKKLIIIGNDLTEETKRYLKEDYIQAIIYQRPKEQGYKVAKYMYDFIFNNNLPADRYVYVNSEILIKENVDLV